MQLTKKSVLWAESGTATKPNDVKIEEGWTGTPPEQPPAEWFNWILHSDEENINNLIDGNNVYDTELSTVITAAGLTPDLTSTGPGNQVLEALQTGGLIVDGGLGDDLQLDHFSGGTLDFETAGDRITLDQTEITVANIYDGTSTTIQPSGFLGITGVDGDQRTLVSPSTFKIEDTRTGNDTEIFLSLDDPYTYFNKDLGGSNNRSMYLNTEGLLFTNDDTEIESGYRAIGFDFSGDNDPSTDTSYRHRFAVVQLDIGAGGSGSQFSDSGAPNLTGHVELFGPGSVDDHGHAIGTRIDAFGSAGSFGIPINTVILSIAAHFTFTNGEKGFGPVTCNGLKASDDDPTLWGVNDFFIHTGSGGGPEVVDLDEPVYLCIHYDGTTLP